MRSVWLVVVLLVVSVGVALAAHLGVATLPTQPFRQPIYSDHVSSSQNGTLFNTRTVSGTNAAVSATIAAAANEQGHVYRVDARCSAGTAALEIESPAATVLWDAVAAASHSVIFNTGWTSAANVAIVVELAACGVGNTGTLIVQADRF